ncbi:hypothetical protein PGB90_002554 [Kerria lacca]
MENDEIFVECHYETEYEKSLFLLLSIQLFIDNPLLFLTFINFKLNFQLLTPMNAILLNQACADFGIAFFGNPVAFYNALHGNWMLGVNYCIIYGFMMSVFGICSIFTLSVLAYQRYNIICHPFSITSHLSWTEAKICIAGTWICSLILSIPPLFGWGSYKPEAANIRKKHTLISDGMRTLMFVTKIVDLIRTYANSMRNRYNIRQDVKTETSGPNVRKVKKAETHVATMVFIMVLAFFVTWGPYAVFTLIITFSDIKLSNTFAIAPSLFAKSSVCYNPIIYFFLNSQFRKSWINRMRFRRSQEEISNEIQHLRLSRIRSQNDQTQNPVSVIERVGMTTVSSIFSSSVSEETDEIFKYRKRNIKIMRLDPYETVPFVRKKFDFKTLSQVRNLLGGSYPKQTLRLPDVISGSIWPSKRTWWVNCEEGCGETCGNYECPQRHVRGVNEFS